MATKNQVTTKAADGQAIVGIQKNLQNVSNVPLVGTTSSMATPVQLLQSRIDAVNVAAASRATWLHDAAAYHALDETVTPVLRALRQYVINVYGPDSPILADFGFAPPKKSPLTTEQFVAKAKKAAATRKARGTMGAKQKKGVKGAVTGIVVTPIVAGPPVTAAPGSPTPSVASAGPTAVTPATPAPVAASPAATTPHTA